MNLLLYVTIVFVPMLFETVWSRRNESRLRASGAVEPAGDVYWLMLITYPLGFVAMLAEGWWRGPLMTPSVSVGFALFVGAKLLKYWAILTLGERWTFRVLVPPGSERVLSGPYRMLRHPNYLAVMGELAGAAFIARAAVAGPVLWLWFGGLVLYRIRVEERALGVS
jgi:methyltransferase